MSNIIDTDKLHSIISHVIAEVERACEIHPVWPKDMMRQIGHVIEEAGETQKACNQYDNNENNITVKDIREEAIQLAAMSLRFILNLE